MAAIKNDGSVPYGSEVLTISGVAFIAENVTYTNPTTFLERRNELNEPSGGVTIQDFINGSATLQLATTATVVPTNGAVFTRGAGITYYLTEIGEPLSQGETKKVSVNFRRALN